MSDRVHAYIEMLAKEAKAAGRIVAAASTEKKNAALRAAATELRDAAPEILKANRRDIKYARSKGVTDAFLDRLMLNEERIDSMASALESIAGLDDPVGRTLDQFRPDSGLIINRVSVPLGVIGMIYESRPNVGADAGALCIKSGNAVILRGGSESRHSSRVIVECLQRGLEAVGLPARAVQLVSTKSRDAVKHMLRCSKYIDLVIPRGGKGLVSLVQNQARVPTLLHLDGNCHTYVHTAADIAKAAEIVRNAKLRRTGICGATESLVLDRSIASIFLMSLADVLSDIELVGDEEAVRLDARIKPATNDDWYAEYLDKKLSIKIVDGLDDAIAWISEHSSAHTDAIVTEDGAAARRFLTEIDSAVVMHNTSTQFSDGGEFGMGAEIGIATGKMHARGPVGLEQLNTFKYHVLGNGQVRP
jgi:glutamate-5-semialdehyde dehydrogenase